MKRNWTARPDEELHLQDGRVLLVVSREAQAEALMDALIMQERAGGVIQAQGLRVPTEMPGEMVTTLYVVTWLDRTDGESKPQPERTTGTVRQADPDPTPEELEQELADEERFLAEAEAGEDESSMEPAAS